MTKKIKITTKNENPKPKHPGGRPSEYTTERADYICKLVATHSIGIPRLCKMYPQMPSEPTIQRWRYDFPEFRVKYAQAKLLQAELLVEECLEISDDKTDEYEDVGKTRLRVDTRKWLASKLLPKQYGDTSLLDQKTEENAQLKEELLQLRAKLNEENKRDF